MNRELDPRISDAVEGRLTGEEWSRFQSDLIQDEGLRSSYVRELWLHQSLITSRAEWADLSATEEEKPASGPVVKILWPLASAASLLIGIALWSMSSSQPVPKPV